MDAIQAIGLTKEFSLRPPSLKEFIPSWARRSRQGESFRALDNVTFSIAQGTTVGVMGRNGSGKSTLLKVIAGVTSPTYGTVVCRGRLSPLLELGAGFSPDLPGRANILLNGLILGMAPAEVSAQVDSILDFAELRPFAEMPVKHYSSGMVARLGFAVAAHSSPDILLLDEILAVGDQAFAEKCFESIRGFQRRGVTIILVSHSPDLIERFCDRTAILEKGSVCLDGTPSEALKFYHDLLTARTG